MIKLLYIGAGGFFGSIARFLVAKFFNNIYSSVPLGTLIVNVSGSFFLGFLIYLISYNRNISPEFRDMLTIGFIGAYTTMSTFAYETFRLSELSEWIYFALNITLNLFFCLAAVFFGKELAVLITK
jgi:CrcB protein